MSLIPFGYVFSQKTEVYSLSHFKVRLNFDDYILFHTCYLAADHYIKRITLILYGIQLGFQPKEKPTQPIQS